MFYGLTTNQEYFEKHISVFVALAPCARLNNANTATCFAANNVYWFVESLESLFGIQEVKNYQLYIESIKYTVCHYLRHFKAILPEICDWDITEE